MIPLGPSTALGTQEARFARDNPAEDCLSNLAATSWGSDPAVRPKARNWRGCVGRGLGLVLLLVLVVIQNREEQIRRLSQPPKQLSSRASRHKPSGRERRESPMKSERANVGAEAPTPYHGEFFPHSVEPCLPAGGGQTSPRAQGGRSRRRSGGKPATAGRDWERDAECAEAREALRRLDLVGRRALRVLPSPRV